MPLESKLVAKVHKYCAKNDLLYINLKDTNLNGIPDSLLINRQGIHIWFELKREDGSGRLSPIQTYRIAEMQGYKCKVHVVASIEELKTIVETYNGK